MKIRRAGLKDIDRLKELYKGLLSFEQGFGDFHFCTDGLVANRGEFYKYIIEKGTGFILAAVDDKKIVGMLVAQYNIGEPGSPIQRPVLIQDVIFLPEYRKKGVGTGIMDKALLLCKRDGREAVHVWVAPENKFLNEKLEEKYGFKTVYYLKSLRL